MYLLDTSVVSDIVDPNSRSHASAIKFVDSNALFADQINICAVTVGEMGFGREILMLRRPHPLNSESTK